MRGTASSYGDRVTWPYDAQPPDPRPDPQRGPFQPPYGQPSPQSCGPAYQQPYAQQPPYVQPPHVQPVQQPYGHQPYQPYAQQPYGQPYQQPYQGFPPPRRRSRGLPWLIGLGVLVVIGFMVGAAVQVFLVNHAPCGAERAPFGASPAAAAYVRAVNASSPSWTTMSKTIVDQGYKVRPDQLMIQVQADRTFVTALKGISFSASEQGAAQSLITSIEQYDAFLQTSAQTPGYLSAHLAEDGALQDAREAASGDLRRALHLPLTTGCGYHRP